MKTKLIILIICLAFLKTDPFYAQHTKRFIEFTKQVKPIDSIIKVKKFRNGKIKNVSKFLIYEYEDYTYKVLSGKQQSFDKKGRLFYDVLYDNFGYQIYQKQFNKSNQLYRIIETIAIDLKPEATFYDVLNYTKLIFHKSYEKQFNSNKKGENLKLWLEGKWLNGKKTGKWKTYNLCDQTFKIKEYKTKNF